MTQSLCRLLFFRCAQATLTFVNEKQLFWTLGTQILTFTDAYIQLRPKLNNLWHKLSWKSFMWLKTTTETFHEKQKALQLHCSLPTRLLVTSHRKLIIEVSRHEMSSTVGSSAETFHLQTFSTWFHLINSLTFPAFHWKQILQRESENWKQICVSGLKSACSLTLCAPGDKRLDCNFK